MNVNPEIHAELLRLLSALCDEQLTLDERTRLEELLAFNEECRRVYLEYLDVHARLLVHPGISIPSQPSESHPITPTQKPKRFRYLSHISVAVASIGFTLLMQLLFLKSSNSSTNSNDLVDDTKIVPQYVATLTNVTDCVWDHRGESLQVGSRLLAGEVKLRRGVARIHFDSGADLVVEAPTILQLNTAHSATVIQGKVVFRADETSAPFDLRTPSSTIIDFGTEYAVMVNPDMEEVHVFEGEIQRTPRTGDVVQSLKAGQARRYDPTLEDGRPTPLDASRFVRKAPDPGNLPLDPFAGLLAYEGFDYSQADDLEMGRANGGFGWKEPWLHAFSRVLEKDLPLGKTLNVREGLARPDSSIKVVGGCFDFQGFTKAFRRMTTPIRMDEEGVYYVSYLFRHHGPPTDPTNAVALLFWTESDAKIQEGDPRKRLNLGVGGANQVFTLLEGNGSRTPLPLTYGETYLLVAKIVASSSNPDQVFIRVYAPKEPVEREEPGGWSVVGPSFRSDLVFDVAQVHINSNHRQTIDEIRIGTSWASVTTPWIPEMEDKK